MLVSCLWKIVAEVAAAEPRAFGGLFDHLLDDLAAGSRNPGLLSSSTVIFRQFKILGRLNSAGIPRSVPDLGPKPFTGKPLFEFRPPFLFQGGRSVAGDH